MEAVCQTRGWHQKGLYKRGRKRLRKALYLAIRPLVRHNPTFRALHRYYTTRPNRPLKKQQSLIALCGKFYVFSLSSVKNNEFDGSKLLQGLPELKALQAA